MAEKDFKRKLTAILSADVEGYSRLMDDNEEATIRTLTAYRTGITNLVKKYRGRVVDSPVIPSTYLNFGENCDILIYHQWLNPYSVD